MKKTRRSTQVSEVVRSEIANILRRELTDPQFALATVTEVEMSPDLKLARVYVSSLSPSADRSELLPALDKAKTKIRQLLGRKAALRYTPELIFRLDETAASADSIERILTDVLPRRSEGGEGSVPMETEDDD